MDLEEGFVSLIPIRFLSHAQVSMYDSEDKEIEIPKCKECDNFKNQLIGKESFMWICLQCGK